MADAPKLVGTDRMRQAYPKINQAIDNANEAIKKATSSDSKSSEALTTANSVQEQFNQVVIEGDSSVEAAQARVKADGTSFTTLKGRLDDTDAQLADLAKNKKLDDLLFKMVNKETTTIVCLGDSVTWGYNNGAVQVTNHYPKVIQDKLNYMYGYSGITVYNEGMPGKTSADGVSNFTARVLGHAPDLVIIMFGLNDNNTDLSIIDYQNNLRTMIDTAKQNNIKVLLMSPTPGIDGISSIFNQTMANYAKAAETIAIEKQIDFINMFKIMSDLIKKNTINSTWYDGATLHFTEAGYGLLADIVIKEKLNVTVQADFKANEYLAFQSPFVQNSVTTSLIKSGNKLKKSYFLTSTKPTESIGFAIFNDDPNMKFRFLTTKDAIGGTIDLLNFGGQYAVLNNDGASLEDFEIEISLNVGLSYFELKGNSVEVGQNFITSGGYLVKSAPAPKPLNVSLTLQNSWVNNSGGYETAKYYKSSEGMVNLIGLIKSGTTSFGTVIANLPSGFRPLNTHMFILASSDGSTGKPSIVEVKSNGDISCGATVSNGYLSLDGIRFLAEQ